MPLSSKQRRYLKALAHPLEPLIRVGKGGVGAALFAETSKTLDAHELIKIRIEEDDPGKRRELASRIAEELGADLVHRIGKIAVLFRPNPDEPDIELP